MKNRFKFLCVAMLVASAGAHAQTTAPSGGLYGELGVTSVKYSYAGYSITPKVLRGVLGYELHPNVAIEGMVGLGVSDGSTTFSGVKLVGEVDHMMGLYVKPKVAVSPDLELFARVGFMRSKVTGSAPSFGVTGSATESDASYGLGARYSFSKTTALVVDYMSYYSKDGEKANGLTIGLGFKF